jgi:hypothetical protein
LFLPLPLPLPLSLPLLLISITLWRSRAALRGRLERGPGERQEGERLEGEATVSALTELEEKVPAALGEHQGRRLPPESTG